MRLSKSAFATAVSTSVAVRAPAPASVTAGFWALCGAEALNVTPTPPLGVLSARVWCVVTAVPVTASGTVTLSPAASARPRVTVTSTEPPFSAMPPEPLRPRVTVVLSSSVSVMVADETVAPPDSLPATSMVSSSSSALSSRGSRSKVSVALDVPAFNTMSNGCTAV